MAEPPASDRRSAGDAGGGGGREAGRACLGFEGGVGGGSGERLEAGAEEQILDDEATAAAKDAAHGSQESPRTVIIGA
jgi:hypothetical protein